MDTKFSDHIFIIDDSSKEKKIFNYFEKPVTFIFSADKTFTIPTHIANMIALMAMGNKVETIKHIRAHILPGAGLYVAKTVVENILSHVLIK